MLADAYFADPFPIARATIGNQIADLSEAVALDADAPGLLVFLIGVDQKMGACSGVRPGRLNRCRGAVQPSGRRIGCC